MPSPPTLPPHPDVATEPIDRVWSGRFPLDVVRFRHRRFDGQMSRLRTWELWRRGRAAAVLPYDPQADTVVLIEQFRLPALAAGIDPVLVEVPAGLVDPGEEPTATGRREMLEEMNLTAGRMERIGDFLLTPGGADELAALYVARVTAPARPGGTGHSGVASEDEDIRWRVWPADRAIADALAGRFANSVTAIALLWLGHRRDWLRERWALL